MNDSNKRIANLSAEMCCRKRKSGAGVRSGSADDDGGLNDVAANANKHEIAFALRFWG